MSVQRSVQIDFDAPEVCSFLNRPNIRVLTYESELTATWQAAGYRLSTVGKRVLPYEDKRVLSTRVLWHCVVRTIIGGRVAARPTVDGGVLHRVTVGLVAMLFTKSSGLAPAKQALIEQAFLATNIDAPSIAKTEASLAQQGVEPDDYQVVLTHEMTKVGHPDESLAQLKLRTFLDQVSNMEDRYGIKLFTVEVLDARDRDCEPLTNPYKDSDVIIGDPRRPDGAILEEARKSVTCNEQLAVTAHPIGTAFQYPEWKTEEVIEDVWFLGCSLGKHKVPHIYSRLRKEVLVGYATSTEAIKKSMETGIRECIIESAIATAIMLLVTSGMSFPAAAAVFSTACLQCLEKKLTKLADCVTVELKLVAEFSDWEEKVF